MQRVGPAAEVAAQRAVMQRDAEEAERARTLGRAASRTTHPLEPGALVRRGGEGSGDDDDDDDDEGGDVAALARSLSSLWFSATGRVKGFKGVLPVV